ncbi:MAG: hypothetical protein AB1746_17540 [Candidatus Zixiibacteriota bacterium]
MDYNSLLSKAFALSWKYKVLWVLGFFAASMGYTSGADNLVTRKSDLRNIDFDHGILQGITDWFHYNPEISTALIVFLAGMLLLLILVFFVMNLISIAGLIEGVYQIERKENIRLSQLFKVGAFYFWRFLGLFFISVAVVLTFLLFLVLPIVLAFLITTALGVLAVLIGIPILFAGIFFFSNIYSLAQREIIAYQTPVFQAIGEAYTLLIKHIGPNVVIFLIQLFLGLAIFICALVLALMFAAPIILMAVYSTWVLIASLIIMVPIFLLIAIVVEGFLGTFFNALLTLFYLELRKLTPKQIIPPSPGPAAMPQT